MIFNRSAETEVVSQHHGTIEEQLEDSEELKRMFADACKEYSTGNTEEDDAFKPSGDSPLCRRSSWTVGWNSSSGIGVIVTTASLLMLVTIAVRNNIILRKSVHSLFESLFSK